jgi:hypothetical protein
MQTELTNFISFQLVMQGRIAQLIIAQPLEQRKADKKTAHLKTHDQRGKKGTTFIPVQICSYPFIVFQ